MKTANGYPCANPFSQLYLIPRNKLYTRFCPFHLTMVEIEDYEHLQYEDLCDIFCNNERVIDIWSRFLEGRLCQTKGESGSDDKRRSGRH